MYERRVTNWGGYPAVQATVYEPRSFDACVLPAAEKIIARGAGRCYGDSSLQRDILSTLSWNKILDLDTENGICHCEAGVLLSDLLTVIVPKGFFLPVTPGTKYITVGGAVAANVHGKNHHGAGAFGQYVESFELMTADGTRLPCSRLENTALFRDTIGGMGLTGIITTVSFHLHRIDTAYIRQQTIKAPNLDSQFELLHTHHHAPYLVGWLDVSSGRGIVFSGEHGTLNDLNSSQRKMPLQVHTTRQRNVPFYLPGNTLNHFTIGLYNNLYYRRHSRTQSAVVHYGDFFYPLDKLRNWNRIYGRGGFIQYQCVLPPGSAKACFREMLQTIGNSRCSAFLAVIKPMGKADEWASPISFPMEGYSLALDLRMTPQVLALLNRLDDIVLHYGGRLYLAKDARMSAAFFQKTYPSFAHPEAFQSLQSQRLSI